MIRKQEPERIAMHAYNAANEAFQDGDDQGALQHRAIEIGARYLPYNQKTVNIENFSRLLRELNVTQTPEATLLCREVLGQLRHNRPPMRYNGDMMYLGYSEDQFDLREIKDVRGVACSFEVLRAGMASYAINLTMRGAHLVDSSSREVIDPQYPAILFGANVTGYADPAAHAQVEVVAEPPAEILFAKKAADVDHWLKQREDNPDIAMTQHMELFAARWREYQLHGPRIQ